MIRRHKRIWLFPAPSVQSGIAIAVHERAKVRLLVLKREPDPNDSSFQQRKKGIGVAAFAPCRARQLAASLAETFHVFRIERQVSRKALD